ncbi:MAG: MerR family transcriptional regulator [Candidatus Omnitrophota bacterium]|nr:MerR family transcriptional regulator [Candidatus Omnitrophota bacterium]
MSWRKEKRIGMTEAVIRIGISAERLRYWELKGIIAPGYDNYGAKRVRRYSDEDIVIASEIRKMVDDDGFSLKGAAERLNRPYSGG